MGRTIAIDGPSGAGKSTVAGMLAKLLGFRYLDTGALYRASALGLLRLGVGPNETDERLGAAIGKLSVYFKEGRVYLNGEDVSGEIRSPEAGHYSSVFSARKPVRDHLLPAQRAAALKDDLVAEGRDIGTVVFPDAWKKFYLDADLDARAKRRYLQLSLLGIAAEMESAREDVVERDRRDTERDVAPLRAAEDAVLIDTSGMTVEAVVKTLLGMIKGQEG